MKTNRAKEVSRWRSKSLRSKITLLIILGILTWLFHIVLLLAGIIFFEKELAYLLGISL
jgi:hypothetical protein